MLATRATAEELALVEGALRALDAVTFGALFDPSHGPALGPGARRERIAMPAPAIARPLVAFGLIEADGRGVVGRHRIRRLGGRFYVMELGVGEQEYLQDVWPETDALLAELERAPPGRLLDLGTGSGVVAVEAAARGHRVVATDLYETALVLARFNARLNRIDGAIELREGHLFEPVAGERFDRVLTNPHYGRADDQLRLEVLRAAPEHLRPGGELVLATVLEWEEGGPLAVEHLFPALVRAGLSVEVAPIAARYKRDWFAAARAEEPIARLTSRHRFRVRIRRPSAVVGADASVAASERGAVSITRPEERDLEWRRFVPISRLARGGLDGANRSADDLARLRGGLDGAMTSAADLARLGEWCEQLRADEARFEGPLPRGLLDGCRFGARVCVGERGAAGAILDEHGGVRPCTHAPPIARAEHSLAELIARLAALDAESEARRGCATCAARETCSRCLFPVIADEPAYCDFIRAHVRELPLVHRLLETVARLDDLGAPAGPLSLRRAPAAPLADALAARLQELTAWLIRRGSQAALAWRAENITRTMPIDDDLATAIATILDGKPIASRARDRLAALLA